MGTLYDVVERTKYLVKTTGFQYCILLTVVILTTLVALMLILGFSDNRDKVVILQCGASLWCAFGVGVVAVMGVTMAFCVVLAWSYRFFVFDVELGAFDEEEFFHDRITPAISPSSKEDLGSRAQISDYTDSRSRADSAAYDNQIPVSDQMETAENTEKLSESREPDDIEAQRRRDGYEDLDSVEPESKA